MNKMMKSGLLNLPRNKRRTFFNIVAVTLCLAVYLIMMAFIKGEKEIMYELGIKFLAGHIQIHQKGYDEKSDLMPPVDITLEKSSEIVDVIKGEPRIVNIKRRIEFPGFISNGTNKIGGFVNGIEPQNEINEIFAERLITEGEYAGRFLEKGNEVLIGLALAELFDFKPGDEIFIVAENKFKQPNMDTFKIVGIFSSGFPLFDETVIFIPLDSASRFMGYADDEANVIHVKLGDRKQVSPLRKYIDGKTENRYEVFSWEHFAPEIVNAVKADEITYAIIIGILLFLMILGLLNTMSMNVFERFQEIGTMRALGFKKSEINLMFLYEGVFTGIAGFIVGLIIGSAVNYYTSTVGIKIPTDMVDEVTIPMWEVFLSNPTVKHVIYCFLVSIIIPAIGAFIPSFRAQKKSIVETLYFIK